MLSYIVLIDMINGFFMMEFSKIPISQIFKFLILVLFLIRLCVTKEFPFIVALILIFQLGPLNGLLKTGDASAYYADVVVATKWINVPLSFFYFKNLFQRNNLPRLEMRIKNVIRKSFLFISLNMFLGLLGLGMAFYHHGYDNAVGTRGYIYAGNELTILLLSLAFIMSSYLYEKQEFKKYALVFALVLFYSFMLTSKTVLGGVLVVFAIPIVSGIKFRIRRKWLDYIVGAFFFGIPALIILFYIGIMKSGVIQKIQFSLKRNDYDPLTVLLSNRNNFLREGWQVFSEKFTWMGKLIGYGQQYHLELSGHLAEIDFFSLLFASGIIGLLILLYLLVYWVINANYLVKTNAYVFAKPTLIFLWFIIIAANLSGHVFGSGISGFFIGLSIALMFYRKQATFYEKQ